MRISTSDFTKAISKYFPARESMVRDWCEEGLLKARRNPAAIRGHWMIASEGIRSFLLNKLEFNPIEVEEVEKNLGINFTQIKLAA